MAPDDVSGPAVELRSVSFAFDRTPVLDDVDLVADRGEFLGVIGPNGGGKTTLLKLVLGLLEPDAGEVRVLGRRPSEARGRIGYVPQHARFATDLPVPVRDVVMMGRLGPGLRTTAWTEEDRAAAQGAMERMELLQLAGRTAGRLSGGQVQRMLIARALAMEPELLLLDEPTSSVDTRMGRNLYGLLEEMSGRVTVVLVSHDIGVISSEVDSVACLNRRLFYHGSEELTPETLEAAYGSPVELVTHGSAHRILDEHGEGS